MRWWPDFIATHGRPEQPKELLGHPCLRTRFESGAQLDWEFEMAGRVVKVSPSGPLLSTHSTLQGEGRHRRPRLRHDLRGRRPRSHTVRRAGERARRLVRAVFPFRYYPS